MSIRMTMFLKSYGLAVGVLMAVALWLSSQSGKSFEIAEDLRENGVTVEAEIVDHVSRRVQAQNGSGAGTGNSGNRWEDRHFLEYRFTTASGEVFTGSKRVAKPELDRTARGSTIPVTYLPGNPRIHESYPGQHTEIGVVSVIIILGALLIGGIFCRVGWYVTGKRARLLDHGVEVDAIVQETGLGEGGHFVKFAYTDDADTTHTGFGSLKNEAACAAHPRGSTIAIVYDPAETSNNGQPGDLARWRERWLQF